MDPDTSVYDGSGNVFEDMGMEDADERLAGAELARVMRRAIRDRGLAGEDARRMLGLEPEEQADLLRGRLTRFSRTRLARLAMEARG